MGEITGITATNDLLPSGVYTFAEDGKNDSGIVPNLQHALRAGQKPARKDTVAPI